MKIFWYLLLAMVLICLFTTPSIADVQICVEAHEGSSGGGFSGGSTTAAEGSINITSFPSGAMISVDRQRTALSPYLFANVPTGSHEITVSMDGYKIFFTQVNVDKGETAFIDAKLIPIIVETTPTTISTTVPTSVTTTFYSVATSTQKETTAPLSDSVENSPHSADLFPILAIVALCIMIFLLKR